MSFSTHTFESVLSNNNVHYVGNKFNVMINGRCLPFFKTRLDVAPKEAGHPLYNLHVDSCAAYVIQSWKTGHVYVGSSGRVYRRISKHKGSITVRKHDNANFTRLLEEEELFKQHFDLIVIFTNTREEAYDAEQVLIDHFGDSNLLINIAHNARNAMTGRPLTEEHRRKIAEANTGKIMSDESKLLMSEFRKTDEGAIAQMAEIHERKRIKISVFGVVYDSITEAGEKSPCSDSYIRRRLKDEINEDIFYVSDRVGPARGKTISEEHKQKLSEFRKTDEGAIAQIESLARLRRKPICFNGVLYESVSAAAVATGIAECILHRKIRKTGNHTEDGAYVVNYVKRLPNKVLIDGVVYESVNEAARLLSITVDTIKNRIRSGKIVYYEN